MEEASVWGFPNSLRMLAANILLYNRPVNPSSFINNHHDILTEDYKRSNESVTESECQEWLLCQLKQILESSSSSLKHVGLPEPERVKKMSKAFTHEYNWDLTLLQEEQQDVLPKLTLDQNKIFQ